MLQIRKIFGSATFWAMIGVALRVGNGLITLPIALRVLSPSELGLYYTFLSLTGLALLIDFGFSQTISRNAAFAKGGASEFYATGLPEINDDCEPNWKLLANLLSTVKKWYNYLGVILIVLMIIPGTAYLTPIIKNVGSVNSYIGCWWLLAVATGFSFSSSYWISLLFGIGSTRSASYINVVSQFTGLLLLVALLLSGFGLWSYGISTCISTTILYWMSKRAFSRDAREVFDVKFEENNYARVFSRLWPMAWRQGLVMLGAFMVQRGNTLICSTKIGLHETAKYGLTLNVLNLVFQVAAIPLSLAWPTIASLRVKRDVISIKSIFFPRLCIGIAFSLAAILVLFFYGNNILVAINAKTTLLGSGTLLLLSLVLYLEFQHSQFAGLVVSENVNPFVFAALISGTAICLISWWAATRYGLFGMIAAQGGVQLLYNNWWPIVRGMRGLSLNKSK